MGALAMYGTNCGVEDVRKHGTPPLCKGKPATNTESIIKETRILDERAVVEVDQQ